MNKLTDFFKVLSDETRLRILVLLSYKAYCVCEICGILEESQPKVSKHLAKLRDMGLVKDTRREQFIYYHLVVEDPVFQDVLKGIIRNIESYPVLKRDAERSKDAEVFFQACAGKVQES